ncbi:MAG: DUF1737 domain-containing protein, partial [Desulfobacula sp.]|nr:DUF1737 domain-containing protein [Desulfobacula sp.]
DKIFFENQIRNKKNLKIEKKLKYRLITGKDDSSFCERISNMVKQNKRETLDQTRGIIQILFV